jgi:hypothetical protein
MPYMLQRSIGGRYGRLSHRQRDHGPQGPQLGRMYAFPFSKASHSRGLISPPRTCRAWHFAMPPGEPLYELFHD